MTRDDVRTRASLALMCFRIRVHDREELRLYVHICKCVQFVDTRVEKVIYEQRHVAHKRQTNVSQDAVQ